MEEFDKMALAVIRVIPDINPDDSKWKLIVGEDSYTKQYILDNWGKDKKMTDTIRELLMHGLIFRHSNLYKRMN